MWLGSEAAPWSSQTVIWTSQCYSLGIFTHTFFLSKRPKMEVFHSRTHIMLFSVLSQMIFSVLFWAFLTSKGQVKCMLLSMTSIQLGKTLGHSLVKKDRKSAEGFLKIVVFENEPFLPFILTWSQSRSLEFL